MSAVRVSPSWLALREPADTAARAGDLVDTFGRGLGEERPIVIHDLACGSGSMLRWLAPRLPGPQKWVCYDLDRDLLALAAGGPDVVAIDGSPVEMRVEQRDVGQLTPIDHEGASLVTASAVLDLLTDDELARVIDACVQAAVPVLFTLSVSGHVKLCPPDPLDEAVTRAFNAHQQRDVGHGQLLGPRAPVTTARAFNKAGYRVNVRPSPWRLGSTARKLTENWFRGWLAAAYEQDPQLRPQCGAYAERRLREIDAGQLRVAVGHSDLLAQPR